MRHLSLLFILLFCSLFAVSQHTKNAQSEPPSTQRANVAQLLTPQGFYYSFAYDRQNYVPMPRGTDLTKGLSWDDPHLKIPLGFQLRFFDQLTDTLYIDAYMEGGLMGISGSQKQKGPLLMFYAANLADRSMDSLQETGMAGGKSPILLQTLGIPGNRISILEFRNAGLKHDMEADGFSEDYVNFQLFFLESSSSIEFHMGPNRIAFPETIFNGEGGPAIGMITEFDFANSKMLAPGLWISGFAQVPSTEVDLNIKYLQDSVPSGMVYQFQRTDISTEVEAGGETPIHVFPNPAKDWVRMELPTGSRGVVNLMNLQGQQLLSQDLNASTKLDVSSFQAGTYVLEVQLEGKSPNYRKIILQ